MKMTFVYKIVFTSLITLFLSTSLVTTKVTQSDVDLCKTRDQFNVIHATNVGSSLLMIIRFRKDDNFDYQVLRTKYVDLNEVNAKRPVSQKENALDEYFKDFPSIKYLFGLGFKDLNPVKEKYRFRVFWSQNDRTTFGVEVNHTEESSDPYPKWNVTEDKWVYNEKADFSEYLNLYLLYSHFPKGVEILDILILNMKDITGKGENKYDFLALVYTSEKETDGSDFYVRHYMRGMQQNYPESNGREQTWIVNWTVNWDWDESCTQTNDKINSVAMLKINQVNKDIHILFAEFYGYNYQEYQLVIPADDNTTQSGRNELQKFYINDVYSESTHSVDQLLNCPGYVKGPNLNNTIELETKPYNGSTCIKDIQMIHIMIRSSALFDNKWLLFIGTIGYRKESSNVLHYTEHKLMIARYIDHSFVMKTKFYEFEVLASDRHQKTTPFEKLMLENSNSLSRVIYLFDFDSENQVTFNVGTDGTLVKQNDMNLIYVNRQQNSDKTIEEVLAIEMTYDTIVTSPYNFDIRNYKMVYIKEGTEDKSVFLNMKLFLMHFPDGVHIEAVVIFRRKIDDKQVSKYNAFVYTEEAVGNETKVYMRHYMKGKPTKFRSAVDNSFSRMSWEFDTAVNACQRLDHGVTAASKLFEIPTPTGITFKIIEFFGTSHRLIEVVFKNKSSDIFEIFGELDSVDNHNYKPNTVLHNCNARPIASYAMTNLSDCYSNEKLRKDYRREGDLWIWETPQPKQSLESDDSIFFWKIVIIVALVIGIISLIAFGFYLRSVELKLD